MNNKSFAFNARKQKQIEAIIAARIVFINEVEATVEDKLSLITEMNNGLDVRLNLRSHLNKTCLSVATAI